MYISKGKIAFNFHADVFNILTTHQLKSILPIYAMPRINTDIAYYISRCEFIMCGNSFPIFHPVLHNTPFWHSKGLFSCDLNLWVLGRIFNWKIISFNPNDEKIMAPFSDCEQHTMPHFRHFIGSLVEFQASVTISTFFYPGVSK